MLALALAAAACGKSGPPLPPLPRGPLPPTRVMARQIGSKTEVSFDAPKARGARPTQQPIRAELVRVTYSPGVQPPSDPDAFRRSGEVVGQKILEGAPVGRMSVEDRDLGSLPGAGRSFTLRYGIRVRDRRGRPSALVVSPDLIPLAETPAPLAVTGQATADGVRISWQPASSAEGQRFNLYRRPAAVRSEDGRQDLGAQDASSEWPEAPLNADPLAATDYLDSDVQSGASYSYMVRVSLADGRPMRESEPSASCAVVAEDRFAPAPPTGLVGVQEGSAVRLFWNPSPERDVQGYVVYRSTNGGSWSPLTPHGVEQPSYLDRDVHADEHVAYRVTARDRSPLANESAPSLSVDVELVAEPVSTEDNPP